ncbi:hypothetical protein IWW36_000096 [Coemansia brasiliensis]|uniref:BZIP domain-containing protein n=1 Tax=Coemansia brasiliensis TaxID=2650707 RepID=A0A9W8IGK7_9FUNG|nr:hypothetical protein IWW36_000096 [Coemansia brasiliensis]
MASNKVEMDKGAGAGDGAKRKHSMVSTAASEIDLSLLDPPRPGRPCRQAAQDPAMQEARKRARVLRNRAAAQLSREKKRQHLEQLEQENAELRNKNKELEERLSRAEDTNAGLAAKLDGLAQQLQSFQTLVLQSQKQSLTPPVLDWSSVTPLVASPMPSCTSASIETSLPFTPSPSQVATATNSMFSADTSLAPSVPAVTVTSAASTNAELVMEATSKASATAELSSKGLSESAVLEQSGAQVPDSQQRMSLQCTESICRKQEPTVPALAMREVYSLTSSCKNWAQRMASMVVAVMASASAESSAQVVWTTFCILWWVLSQSGGWISKPQLSRMARGILEHSSLAAANGSHVKMIQARSLRYTGSPPNSLAGLATVAAWLSPGSRTASALRRVAGDKSVDQVAAFVAALRGAVRSANARRQRVRVCTAPLDKLNHQFLNK